MTEFRDLSSLPGDPEYWASLESRILQGLQGETHPVVSPGGEAGGWWSPIEAGAAGIAVTALAAVLVALLLLPPRRTSGSGLLITPADPAGASIISAPAPPQLASLILSASRTAIR